MPRAFVTDGRSLSALACARALGERGIDVECGDSFSPTITSFSRQVSACVEYPDAGEEPEAFASFLRRRVESNSYDLVVPTRDDTAKVVAAHRSALSEHTGVVVPDHETMRAMLDKKTTMQLAERQGVPVPATYYPDEAGIDAVAERVDYPALVKPRRGSGARGIRRADSPTELRRAYTAVRREHGPAIVQEYVDHSGGHFSVGTVFDNDSEPVAVHVYEEIAQYPDSGGPAVEAVTVDVDPWVGELLDLLRAVGWVGPAHIDVLRDPVDGTHRLLEVNPRLWTSINLTIESGVDVPGHVYDLATGSDTAREEAYRSGLRQRWLLPAALLWAASGSDRLCRLRRLLADWDGPTRYGVLSRTDPGPTAGVVAQSIGFALDSDKRRQLFDRGW